MHPRAPKLLEDIRSAADFVKTATDGLALQQFKQNRMLRQAVERNFEIIGEAMRRLEKDDPDTAARITDYRRIIAFRNLLIHGYDVIYPAIGLSSVEVYLAPLMAGVQAGGDRQELHEQIRVHSQAAADQVKQQGSDNDLISRLQTDSHFAAVDLAGTLDASRYIGRAPEQVDQFIEECVQPVREKYAVDLTGGTEDLRV